MSMDRIRVGRAIALEGRGEQCGEDVVVRALEPLHGAQPSLIFLFSSARDDLEEIVAGAARAAGKVPLIGASTAGEIYDGPHDDTVVVLAFASPHLRVHVGVGRDVSNDWRRALDEMVSFPGVAGHFRSNGGSRRGQLQSEGWESFGLLFAPGNTRGSDSLASELTAELLLRSGGKLPLAGGCAADNWKMDRNYVIHNDGLYTDGALLAIVETQLQFGMSMLHGLSPAGRRAVVTASDGHCVQRIDGRPAIEVVREMWSLPEDLPADAHLTLKSGCLVGSLGAHGEFLPSVASYSTDSGGIRLSRPVPEGATITSMSAAPEGIAHVSSRALCRAKARSASDKPVAALVFSCALRRRMLGESTDGELPLAMDAMRGAPLVGFYSFGEQGLMDDGSYAHGHAEVSVVVFGDDLNPTAKLWLNEQERAKERRKTLALLEGQRDIALALGRVQGLDELAARCTQLAIRVGGFDAGGLYVVEPSSGALALAYHEGLSERFVQSKGHAEPGSTAAEMVLRGKPIFADYADIQRSGDEVARAEGLRSIAILPTVHEDRVVGCLNLASRSLDEISDLERTTLQTVSRQIGQALSARRALDAVAEREQNLRTFFEGVRDFLFVLDERGCILETNRKVLDTLGWSEAELHGQPVLVVHPEPRREEAAAVVADMIAGRRSVCTVPLSTRDGREIPVETSVTTGHWNGRQAMFGVCRDVSERVRSEERLRVALARMNALLDNMSQGVLFEDEERRVRFANRTYCDMFGLAAPETIIGSDRPGLARVAKPLFRDPDGFERGIDRCHAAGKLKLAEVLALADGRTLERDYIPVSIDEERRGVFWVYRDVSSRLEAEAERQSIEQQFRETQRLESLGVLAGGIAHDFNNILAVIMVNAGLALDDIPPESPVRECIQEISSASTRAADLCTQMLAYAGKGRIEAKPIDLKVLIEKMRSLLGSSISKRARLVLDLKEHVPPIVGDSAQLQQLVVNLVTNASEAIGERDGTIRVGLTRRTWSPDLGELLLPPFQGAAGDYVFLTVQDDGAGMDEATQTRMFEPFFTTKFTGRGLGMAAVLGIVQSHNGALRVESVLGRGTTVRVMLPFVDERSERRADGALTSRRTVLVVDDEESVIRTVRSVLGRAGMVVLGAANGREAVDVYRARGSEVDLVLLDLLMPEMDGIETYHALKAIDPDVRIVISSGYSERVVAMRREGLDLAATLKKPYTALALRQCIERLIRA